MDAQGRLVINDNPPVNHCKPSADVTLHSLAKHFGPRVLTLILTGMGDDGASGALAIKRAGGVVVAQDEATCVVFGMPKEAIKLGAAQQVMSLDSIPEHIVRYGR